MAIFRHPKIRFPVKLLLIWKEDHERLVQIQGVKTYSDFHVREELLCLQRENVELSQQLKAKDDWENRKKQYQIVKTNGGSVVLLFADNPQYEYYACPSCFEKESIQILQDQDNVAGTFQCPGCKTHFRIKPRKAQQKFATGMRNPLSRTNT